jgi:hypothetical protein
MQRDQSGYDSVDGLQPGRVQRIELDLVDLHPHQRRLERLVGLVELFGFVWRRHPESNAHVQQPQPQQLWGCMFGFDD